MSSNARSFLLLLALVSHQAIREVHFGQLHPPRIVVPLVPEEEDDSRGYHDVRGDEGAPVEGTLEGGEALDEQRMKTFMNRLRR